MKNTTKKILGFVGLGLGAILLSSCTANFCSNVDKANMAYPYEQGVTVYCEKDDVPTDYKRVDKYSKTLGVKEACLAIDGNTTVYKYVPCEVTTNSGTTSSSSATSGATSVTTSAAATSASSASSSAVTTTTYKYTANKASYLQNTVISSATTNGYRIPSIQYLSAIDDYVLRAAIVEAQLPGNYTSDASYDISDKTSAFSLFVNSITVSTVSDTVWCVNPYTLPDPTSAEAQISANQIRLQTTGGNSILRRYGEMKFSGLTLKDGKVSDHPLWGYWTAWNQELKFSTDPGLGVDGCPSNDFVTLYKNDVTSKVNSITSCISTQTDYFGHYGNFADWEVSIERKDWSYAWNKGFLEGLLVYPISWMVDTFAYGMDPTLSGVGQIWAIVFVTLIVRGIMLLATFKTTLDQQKMQALQPQLAKLQAKYPNSNTNTAEKQRLAQEQMALYKRNKIHPFGQFIVLIFQFPIFICVWSALQGSAALSSGEFLNMRLSDTIKDILFNVTGTWYYNTTGWWTALILFILMAATQFFAMFLPQLITKIRTKKEVTRLSKNPAQDSTQKQMKWITYGMLAFTIIMGFFLPAAMGIYWLIGGLISMAQTGITQIVMAKSAKKKGV